MMLFHAILGFARLYSILVNAYVCMGIGLILVLPLPTGPDAFRIAITLAAAGLISGIWAASSILDGYFIES